VKPKVLDGLVLVYGLVLIALGVIGFMKDGSAISLGAGLASGIIVLIFLGITAKKRQIGRIGVAVVSLALLGQFGMKSLKAMNAPDDGKAVWHVYTIAIASLIVFLALGLGHMSAMKERKLE
jgi:uncharacterized membrane protein (UPF0136 family)